MPLELLATAMTYHDGSFNDYPRTGFRVFRIVMANFFDMKGFIINALPPICLTRDSVRVQQCPEQNTTGISGRIFMSAAASLSPVIPGMTISVITRSI